MWSSWKEVVNQVLDTYATEDVIAKTETEMQSFKLPSSRTPNQYAEALWKTALRCNQVHTEYMLKGIFVGRLPYSIRDSMRSY